jgi:hypothetical protein
VCIGERGFWLTNPNSSNKGSQQRGALAGGHSVALHVFRGVVIMLAVILNLGVSTSRTIGGLLVCLGSFFWKFVFLLQIELLLSVGDS